LAKVKIVGTIRACMAPQLRLRAEKAIEQRVDAMAKTPSTPAPRTPL
jgi:hypothetical protein